MADSVQRTTCGLVLGRLRLTIRVIDILYTWVDLYFARDFCRSGSGKRLTIAKLLAFIDELVEMGFTEKSNRIKLAIWRVF